MQKSYWVKNKEEKLRISINSYQEEEYQVKKKHLNDDMNDDMFVIKIDNKNLHKFHNF